MIETIATELSSFNEVISSFNNKIWKLFLIQGGKNFLLHSEE
jgi:hypothetical protein